MDLGKFQIWINLGQNFYEFVFASKGINKGPEVFMHLEKYCPRNKRKARKKAEFNLAFFV
jgi:hypothetical protein